MTGELNLTGMTQNAILDLFTHLEQETKRDVEIAEASIKRALDRWENRKKWVGPEEPGSLSTKSWPRERRLRQFFQKLSEKSNSFFGELNTQLVD